MGGYVLMADCAERRAGARMEELAREGRDCYWVHDAGRAREMLAGAAVLVVGEFGESEELLGDLRAGRLAGVDARLPVIATADSEAEIIAALEAGADLTVSRGASGSLVCASVAAAQRRMDSTLAPAPATLKVGGLEVNAAAREVTLDGRPVRLTGREMDVLALLAQAPGRVFTRDEISWEVWGGPDLRTSRAMDSHISNMAKKFRAVSPGARVVENVHGRGYKMTANPGGVER